MLGPVHPASVRGAGTDGIRQMKLSARAVIAAVLLILAAAGAGFYFLRESRAPANVVMLYGDVDLREMQPAFYATGRITRMLVQEGDTVRKGQLLAEIDDVRYRDALAQTRHQQESSEQALARLLNGSRPEEIRQAQETMLAQRSLHNAQQKLYERVIRLIPSGAEMQQRRDDVLGQTRSIQHTYLAAEQAYLLALQGPRTEDIEAGRAVAEAAAAATRLAEDEYRDAKLVAPADGVVEARILEPGDMASPSVPVYTIALTDPLWVRAYLSEADLGRVALGMRARIATDSFPGKAYAGWVGYISPTAEFTPKTIETPELRTRLVYQVRIFACDAGNELRLGMPATVTIDLAPPPTGYAPGCASARPASGDGPKP